MKLFEFQEAVLNKTEKFNHVGYFLDMGLGKTFVGGEKLIDLDAGTNLIVCQKSKVTDWVDHFRSQYEWIDDVLDLTNKKQLEFFKKVCVAKRLPPKYYAIGVINYELAFRRSYLAHIDHFTLLLDESQYIANEGAKRSKFVLQMNPQNVILLSGTPVNGKYEQLWSQCQLLGWQISKKAFWNTFVMTEWVEDHDTGFRRQVVTGYKNVERLKNKLAEHGAVFMKTEEAFDLPEQQEIRIKVKTTSAYKIFCKNSYYVLPDGKELIGDTALTKSLYARELCGQYCDDKLQAFQDLIESTNERLIVFYNFTEELSRLWKIAVDLERPVSIVNGKTKDLEAYEKCDNAITFVQYQAGATGLNLQKAHITVYYSLPFGKGSCGLWEQSKKRTHRIGQETKCLYYYLLCVGSIEEKNLENLKIGKDYNEKLFEKELV